MHILWVSFWGISLDLCLLKPSKQQIAVVNFFSVCCQLANFGPQQIIEDEKKESNKRFNFACVSAKNHKYFHTHCIQISQKTCRRHDKRKCKHFHTHMTIIHSIYKAWHSTPLLPTTANPTGYLALWSRERDREKKKEREREAYLSWFLINLLAM